MSIAEPKPFDRARWLEDRRKAIGASDVAAILGISPYASAWDVWAEKTGRVEGWDGNEATRLGQFFEPGILDYAESKLGELSRGERILHDSLPVAATLDARCVADGRPVEAKTTGLAGPVYGSWGDELTDQVPDYYLVQVHTQLLCTKADLAYLFALLPGRGVVQFEIERSDKVCDRLGEILHDWWEKHVLADVQPSIEKASYEIVKRLKRVPNKCVELNNDVASLLDRYEKAKRVAKKASEIEERYKTQLLASIGDAELATFEDGRSLTYTQQTRKGYVVQDSTFRVLRVKKAK